MGFNIKIVLTGLLVTIFVLVGVNTFAKKETGTRTMLQVSKLSCGSCLSRIDTRLKELPGYMGMAADLRRGLVAVDHQTSLKNDKIAAAITGIGYPATVLASGDPAGKPAPDFNTGKQSGYSCCGGGGYGGCGAASGSWKRFFGYQSE
ncbi:MAG: heavy-metal-associated domain-containing protein [Deltaproteobacteria bacterium]|nr:heavy-metal-associated domain-containing protein [Deltaproteobacteria bacterium]